MKPDPKLSLSQQREQQAASRQQQIASEGLQEFASAEEMLQYDASQTTVPPKVALRLQRSLGPGKDSWWKRWFGW
jgi:hypothetical protein